MQNPAMLTAAALSSQPMTLQQSAAAAAHLVPALPSSPQQPVSVFQPALKPQPTTGPQQLGHQQQQQQHQQQQQQQATTMQHFLLASQFPVPQAPLSSSQSQLSKPLEANGGGGMNSVSLVEMASIISPMTKRRAESFVLEEIRVMLQEIERRKHILLSVSPASNKLKRRAWEEVANCMALRWPQETRRTGDQIKKKWENLVSKTKRKIRDGQMTPDLDWNETNTLVMQFLASTTAAMRRKPMPPPPSASTNTMSSLFDYGHLLPACSVGSGDTNATTYGSAANAQNYLAVFPSTVAESTFNGASSNAGTTGGCNNMGQKMEEATDRVGHEESSNDATALEETERNSRDGEPSVPGANPRSAATNHNASAWTNLSVDESVLSNLAPLSGNPLLNIPHLGFHPSSAAIQEELMAHARIEHRLRVQILRMQKRAWHLKLEWLERRRTRSRQSDGGSEVAASTSLNAGSANAAAADAPLQNGTNGSGGAGGDGWAGDMVGDEEEEDEEDEDEDEEEDL